MTAHTVYQIGESDLQRFLNDMARKQAIVEDLTKFRNTMVSVAWVAELHQVSKATVINYINDGLIVPEVRNVERGKYFFRADYAISLDFNKLKKQMLLNK